MHNIRFHLPMLLIVSALLHGCASQPPALRDSEWLVHQTQLQQLQQWQFRGKVAVRTPDNAESASLLWTQQLQQSQLVFSGPMGWNQLTLLLNDGQLTLFRDGSWQTVSSADDLEQMIGWQLPVDYLGWWVKGLPAPDQKIKQMELEDGRLSLLEQAGWTLNYDGYRQAGNWVLPTKIRFEQEGISGKILLKEWIPGP